jgi:hypothetical protein
MDLLTTAKALTERVEAEATQAKIPVSVCVIDIHGNLVLQHRMNGAPAFSMEISERKAYTSALVGIRTADLVPLVQPGQPLYPLLTVSGGGATPPWAEACRSQMRATYSPASASAAAPTSRTLPSWRRRSDRRSTPASDRGGVTTHQAGPGGRKGRRCLFIRPLYCRGDIVDYPFGTNLERKYVCISDSQLCSGHPPNVHQHGRRSYEKGHGPQ